MTMSAEKRIHELRTRQVYYGSSLTCRLNAVKGLWYYTIYVFIDEIKVSKKLVLKQAKYNGEDPEDLFVLTLKENGLRKIKLGVPMTIGGNR